MEEAGGGGFWGATSIGYEVGDCRSKRRGLGAPPLEGKGFGGIVGAGGEGRVTAGVRGRDWRHHHWSRGKGFWGGITGAGGGVWVIAIARGRGLGTPSKYGKGVGGLTGTGEMGWLQRGDRK
ncbi:unnamed protein product [Ilex paraguariensis]|uniref:Uncharacterized protein n=1 Tax=Ilex paraguariensis TaxID=185542 RepID=A0ABC8U8D6_9AQUA